MEVVDKYAKDFNGNFYYDPEVIGCLRRKISSGNNKFKKDSIAGGIKSGRYPMVYFSGHLYLSHRVVWIIHNGAIPEKMVIDHIDGDTYNNRIENLRVVTLSINKRNQRKTCVNSSGINGVHFEDSKFPRWRAEWVKICGKSGSKSFSVGKYGNQRAFELACAFREKQIEILNSVGEGYSGRHGH